jgi:hypothetical protein
MVGEPEPQSQPEVDINIDLTLLQQTLDMIELAKTKGFEWTLSISPAMWEHWMPFQEVFSIQACAVVSWWLRDRHKLLVWIEPVDNNRYRGFIKYFGIFNNAKLPEAPTSYEQVLLTTITEALNALPDADKNTTDNK